MSTTAPDAKATNPLQALRAGVAVIAAGSAGLAALGGGYASAALLVSVAASLVTVIPRVSRGPARISAATLGVAAAAWVAGVVATLAGSHGPLWAVLLMLVATLIALAVALGVRALERPATCAPSTEVARALAVIPGVRTEVPMGAGGTVLVTDTQGSMAYLVGQVSGNGDTFEESLAYQEFTAILTRVRRSLKLDGNRLRGVVVIPELDRFGPLRVKGADEIVACSKSQLRKALARKLRGK